MASYDASINVRVTGTGMVDGVLNRVQELERLVKDINTRPINLSKIAGRGELADRFGKAAKELNGLKNSFINSERAVEAFGTTASRTIANTTALSSTFKRIADNSDIASNQFREFTVAAQQAAVAANTLGRTRLATLAEELSFGGAGGKTIGGGTLVKELLQQEAAIPNSIAALNAYQGELNDLRVLVDVTSKEFQELELAISRVQARMDLAEGRGPMQGPAKPPRGQGKPKPPTGKGSKMLENLMLGAGFPLLFGGGAGEVAGGLLGSFVGEGFGGQILGSAIGRIIQDFGQAAIDLAKTLESPASSFEQIKEKSLLSSKAQERYVETLIKNGEIVKANAVIYADFNKRFGETSLTSLRTNSDKLARSMAELGVRMQLVAAGPFDKFIGSLNNILAGVNLDQAATQLSSRLQGPQRAQFEQERARIAGLQFKGVFGGITQEQAVQQMLELLDKYEKFVPKKNVPLSVDDLKLQLEAGRALRDVYAENFKLQLEKGLAVKVLNGELLQDYVRANEIQNEYLATNEKLAVVIKNVKDIEAAGGVAKGIISAEEMGKLKNEITALENKKLDLKIQVNKESLALFEKEIKAAGDRATRALELQAGAVRGRETIAQSQFALQKSINDLYSQRLDMEVEILNKTLEQTTSLAQQEAIFNRLREIANIRYAISISNAKIERASAYAQIRANLELLAIEVRKQEVAFKVAQATMFEAKAKGLLNRDYVNAVEAQSDALELSRQNYDFAVRNAEIQERIADTAYRQKIEAAGFARNMEIAAINTRQAQAAAAATASTLNSINSSTRYGQGLGQFGRKTVLGERYTVASQSFTVPIGYQGFGLTPQMYMATLPGANSIAKYATGGYVKNPTFAMIAEAGQGEYVVPESKAAQFAMNYMMGSRGTAAIDGNAGSPTVNITTGPVMQQDGQMYVTLQDFEQGLQTMANSLLGNNRSAGGRRYAGVA